MGVRQMTDKEIILDLQKERTELLIEIKELKDNEMRLKQENCFSQEKVKRLQQQIEKMKCCYLCKSVYNCAFADVFNFHCCDKWKLAKLQKRKL
jgi:hypothetical protein